MTKCKTNTNDHEESTPADKFLYAPEYTSLLRIIPQKSITSSENIHNEFTFSALNFNNFLRDFTAKKEQYFNEFNREMSLGDVSLDVQEGPLSNKIILLPRSTQANPSASRINVHQKIIPQLQKILENNIEEKRLPKNFAAFVLFLTRPDTSTHISRNILSHYQSLGLNIGLMTKKIESTIVNTGRNSFKIIKKISLDTSFLDSEGNDLYKVNADHTPSFIQEIISIEKDQNIKNANWSAQIDVSVNI